MHSCLCPPRTPSPGVCAGRARPERARVRAGLRTLECGGRGRRSRGLGPSPGKGGSASPVGEDWGLLPHSPEHVPLSTTELTRQRRTYPEPPRRSPSRVLCSGGLGAVPGTQPRQRGPFPNWGRVHRGPREASEPSHQRWPSKAPVCASIRNPRALQDTAVRSLQEPRSLATPGSWLPCPLPEL